MRLLSYSYYNKLENCKFSNRNNYYENLYFITAMVHKANKYENLKNV